MVASSTFISDTILFIRDYLRVNLVDPLARGANNTKYVFTAYPKSNTQYPLITIKVNNMQTKRLGMQSETNWVDLKIEIRCWARNSKEVDNMTQDVINTMRLAQYGTDSTNSNSIFGFTLENCNTVVEGEGDNTIHSKICNFTYSTILQ